MLLNANPQWLALSREERSQFVKKDLHPIFDHLSDRLDLKFYDSEYFHSSFSDYLIIQTYELDAYQTFIELLRDTKVYSVPFFEVKEIIIGIENQFEVFDEQFKKGVA